MRHRANLRPALALTACVLALTGLLTGCESQRAVPSTDLSFSAVNPNVGRAAFHLTCDPDGGDLGNASRACSSVRADPSLVTNPKPFTCYGGTFSWWDVTITGRLSGRQIHSHTSTCWTEQMALIRRLGIGWQSLRRHLLPRRREQLLPSSEWTFPGGTLQPADLVICNILGHELEQGVPIEYVTSSTSFGGENVMSVTLSVTRNNDGSVTAKCHEGT